MTHETHKTRYSDSSIYDEVCIYCGATDAIGDRRLDQPCPANEEERIKKRWANASDR